MMSTIFLHLPSPLGQQGLLGANCPMFSASAVFFRITMWTKAMRLKSTQGTVKIQDSETAVSMLQPGAP